MVAMVKLLAGGALLIASGAVLLPLEDEAARRRAAEAEARAAVQIQFADRFCPSHFDDVLDRADCYRSFGLVPAAATDLDRQEVSR
jgi:hypothetical protein